MMNKNFLYKLIILTSIEFLYIVLFQFNNLMVVNSYLKNKTRYMPKNFSRIIAISYANEKYKKQLEVNKKSALEIGKVNEYYSYGPKDIDQDFKNKNKYVLSLPRGNGYWLWKPYFILKTLREKLNDGDYLIYTDADILYMNSTYTIIEFMKKNNAEMWAVEQPHIIERIYTKRDAFILLCLDSSFYSESPQYMAGIQIYRKSKFTEKFLEDLLYYSSDKRIITDNPNILGKNNYEGFKENRHDQSVFSLLIKKYGLVNTAKTNMIGNNTKLKLRMPFIFCIYSRKKYKDFNDIMRQCINQTMHK